MTDLCTRILQKAEEIFQPGDLLNICGNRKIRSVFINYDTIFFPHQLGLNKLKINTKIVKNNIITKKCNLNYISKIVCYFLLKKSLFYIFI